MKYLLTLLLCITLLGSCNNKITEPRPLKCGIITEHGKIWSQGAYVYTMTVEVTTDTGTMAYWMSPEFEEWYQYEKGDDYCF